MVLERFQIILSNREPDNKSGILWLHKRQGYYVLEFFGERGWTTLGSPFAEEVGQTLEERVSYLEETIAKKTSGFTTIEAAGGKVKSTSPSYKCKFYSKTGTLEVTKGEGQSISIDLGQPFIESISNKLQKYSDELEKLQKQIDSNHTELGEAFEGLYDDVEKNYSKKSNTLRHLTLSSSATANGMSLLLEGEYDDSVQGSHILGPHNIILPYATESKAGIMSPEDKKALTQIIEGGIEGGAGIIQETDPVFSASPASGITEKDIASWNSKQDAITDLESIRLGSSKGAASLQYSEVSEEIDDVETNAQGGKTAFDTFMDNIDVDYAYDSSTGANYTVIRVYKTKLDGTKQYPFVVVPDVNENKYSTLDFMENFADDNGYLFAINSGLGSPATLKIDGIAVQNGVIVNNVPAIYHAGSMPLTIDTNGDLSYAASSADANELVASGIVSAICGFCPIIVDYNTVSPPTVSNVSHFTQNAQRQIIGQFGNGDYAIITCEGRKFNNSDGWTIAEAQTICKKLGLKFAYNLDGGGSTQTVIGRKQLNIIYENEKGRTLPSFIVFNGRSELGVMPDVPDVQVTLESISATYSGGDVEVGTDLATLTGVVVTATYSDGSTGIVSGYTLSGEIAEGENVITVSYRDKTTTFTIVGITSITGQLVWVIGTTDSTGTWDSSSENHRGALYTTENTGSIVALDIDSNSAVNEFNVPSGLTGKLYLPRIPEGVTKLSWSNSDSNVLEAVWLRDSSGTKIAEVNTSYGMASPIDLTEYPTAVYWNCDCKYGQLNAKIYANPDNGDSEAYNRYQVVCNTKFTFS